MLSKILVGRYQIIKHLGGGGFGETFIAHDTQLPGKPECVVKKLKTQSTDLLSLETARRLFDTEAQVLHKLGNHNQIPQLLAYFEENQEFYLVQEFIVGHDLYQELTPGEQKDEQQVISLLIEILQILDFVHQQQVIHRDINPRNILRREQDGKLVLIDFGAVKQISTQIFTPEGKTRSTVIIGTPGYIPGEQAQGNPKFSSDIYALGIIGIQALTGLAPEELEKDEDTHEIIWRSKAQVSPELGQILDNMLRYDFRQRFSSADLVLESLRNLSKQSKTSKTFIVAPKLEKLKTAIYRNINYKKIFIQSLSIIFLLGGGVIAYVSIRDIFNSENAKELYQKANTFYDLKRYQDAIEAYENVIEIEPDFFEAWNGQGKTFYELKKYPEALEAYENAIKLKPNELEAWEGRGLTLFELGQYKYAIDSFNKALSINQEQPKVWNILGESLSNLNEDSQAIHAYDKAIELNQKFDVAWNNKGKSLHKLHRYKDAVEAYKQATNLKTDNAEAWYNLGNAQASLKRHKEAFKAYNEAVRHKPSYYQAWLSKGNMLVNLRRYSEAVEAFDQVIKYQPKNYRAWYAKGWSLHQMERYESAIDSYDRAIALEGRDYNSWYNKGNSLYKLERYKKAIVAYDQAINFQPEHFESWYSKGNALFDLKRYKDAVTAYEQAIKIKPNDKKAKKARDKAQDELDGSKSGFNMPSFRINLW